MLTGKLEANGQPRRGIPGAFDGVLPGILHEKLGFSLAGAKLAGSRREMLGRKRPGQAFFDGCGGLGGRSFAFSRLRAKLGGARILDVCRRVLRGGILESHGITRELQSGTSRRKQRA